MCACVCVCGTIITELTVENEYLQKQQELTLLQEPYNAAQRYRDSSLHTICNNFKQIRNTIKIDGKSHTINTHPNTSMSIENWQL